MTRVSMSWNFDEKAFRREVEREARGLVAKAGREMETALNRLSDRLKGQPLDVIRPELTRAIASAGGSITEPELTQYAESIQSGARVHVEVQPFDL